MKQATDVIIVGGGIIGCSIAYSLRKQGVDVVVLEKGEIGAQSSSAASGLLAPLRPFAKRDDPYTSLLLSCLTQFPTLIQELEEMTGIDIEYTSTGTLRLYAEKSRFRLEKWVEQWRQVGLKIALLSQHEVYQYEAGLRENISCALYNPHEPQLNAVQFVQAYARAAQLTGALLFPFEEVVSIEHRAQKVSHVHTVHGHTLTCHHLVLATGAWSPLYGGWLGLTLPIYPLRGQNIAVQQPPLPIQHILFGDGVYLAPKKNGMIIIGTARDEAGFAVETTEKGITWLYTAAQSVVPALASSPIEYAWAGLLPRTPDTRPILGAAPHWENVTLACGHNGLGLLFAPVSDGIAQYISTGQLDASLQPFSLKRF